MRLILASLLLSSVASGSFDALNQHITVLAPPKPAAIPFDLTDVRLLNGFYHDQQQKTLDYLVMLDTDQLLYMFREVAGLPTPGRAFGGWEEPTSELRGHITGGHYLSAAAMMWASTGNITLQNKMRTIVVELGKCQDKIGTGYLSAFPTSLFDRLENLQQVWAPYYTIHKIMAGLLDQHVIAKDPDALKMVIRMADYFKARTDKVIQQHGMAYWQRVLQEEWGGMNEIMFNLYAITQNPSHLEFARVFDHYAWSVPLFQNQDDLNGNHANTHIPEVIGNQANHIVVGNTTAYQIAYNFFNIVTQHHSFSTGGSSDREFWGAADQMGSQLNPSTEESCTQYNILKIARNFFQLTGNSSYLDFYELAITNGIVGNQRNAGEYIYMLPLGGQSLLKGGWGNPTNSFWCCYGTLMESMSKLGDSIYFTTPEDDSVIVNLYTPSRVNWRSKSVVITQTGNYPVSETQTIQISTTRPAAWSLKLRIPGWTRGATVTVNGAAVSGVTSGTLLEIRRTWSDGDTVVVTFPMRFAAAKVQDNRRMFQNTSSLMYGPLVLAGLTDSSFLDVQWSDVANFMSRTTQADLRFQARTRDGSLVPFMALYPVVAQRYTVYFNANREIAPYNPAGTKIPTEEDGDFLCEGGASVISNPVLSLRSGNPHENNIATAIYGLQEANHRVTSVSLAYQYITGYGRGLLSGSANSRRENYLMGLQQTEKESNSLFVVSANFSMYLEKNGVRTTFYQSPPLVDYPYDTNPSGYSPPVSVRAPISNFDVSQYTQIKFSFHNNDRNVQLKLGMNLVIGWS